MNFDYYLDKIEIWQSLIGAFMGALIPITFSLILLWLQNENKFRRLLEELDMWLLSAITEVYAARKDLELFVERMNGLVGAIDAATSSKFFFANSNFPTIDLRYDDKFIQTKTKSLYLANKLLACHVVLKDINSNIADFQYDFRRGLRENHEYLVAASEMQMTPNQQKSLLRAHAVSMKEVVQGVLLNANLPTAIRNLVTAREYLLIYRKAPTLTTWWFRGPFGIRGNNEEIDRRLHNRTKRSMARFDEQYKKMWAGFSTAKPAQQIER